MENRDSFRLNVAAQGIDEVVMIDVRVAEKDRIDLLRSQPARNVTSGHESLKLGRADVEHGESSRALGALDHGRVSLPDRKGIDVEIAIWVRYLRHNRTGR